MKSVRTLHYICMYCTVVYFILYINNVVYFERTSQLMMNRLLFETSGCKQFEEASEFLSLKLDSVSQFTLKCSACDRPETPLINYTALTSNKATARHEEHGVMQLGSDRDPKRTRFTHVTSPLTKALGTLLCRITYGFGPGSQTRRGPKGSSATRSSQQVLWRRRGRPPSPLGPGPRPPAEELGASTQQPIAPAPGQRI